MSEPATSLAFAWLEITGRCQLSCTHCYADSSPHGTHGAMAANDWQRAIDELAGLGVRRIQLIGGEPTLHPAFVTLVEHAHSSGLVVEVFSNLTRIRPEWWALFADCRVELATSYYSDDPQQHQAITGHRGSHERTRANIAEAVQ